MKKFAYLLLCLLAVGSISSAWYLERKKYTQRLKQDFLQHAHVSNTLDAPRESLLVAMMLSQIESGELSQEEFNRYLKRQLYIGLSEMYLHRNSSKHLVIDIETEEGYSGRVGFDNPSAIRRDAGRALSLLGIESSEELNKALKKHEGHYDMFGQDDIFDEEQNIRGSYAKFIDECISEHAKRTKEREFLERMKQNRSEPDDRGNG